MSGVVLNLAVGVVAGIIVAILGLFLFDREKLYLRLESKLGLTKRRNYSRISSRTQVNRAFFKPPTKRSSP